jgi:glutaredoxin 3
MKRVIVYSTEPCGHCRNAKALLASRGIDFEEINLAKDPDGRDELVRRTGLLTFPQVLVDGEPVGGFRELLALERTGGLEALDAD